MKVQANGLGLGLARHVDAVCRASMEFPLPGRDETCSLRQSRTGPRAI